jgi:hypothetical protein
LCSTTAKDYGLSVKDANERSHIEEDTEIFLRK